MVQAQGYEGKVSLGFGFGINNQNDDHPINNAFGEFSNAVNRLMIDVINGYRFHPNIYTGIGVGVRKYFTNSKNWKSYNMFILPLFGHVKSNFTRTKVSPFVEISPGYAFVLYDEASNELEEMLTTEGGFFMDFAVGIDILLYNDKSLSIAIGHEMQNITETFNTYYQEIDVKNNFSALYITLGYIF